MASLGGHAYPVQFPLQSFLTLAFAFLFLGQAFGFLFQPTRIIALVGNAFPPVQFQNPTRHIVQEITIVCYGNNGAFVTAQMLFQPIDAFGIQMVGRLVQQKNFGLL